MPICYNILWLNIPSLSQSEADGNTRTLKSPVILRLDTLLAMVRGRARIDASLLAAQEGRDIQVIPVKGGHRELTDIGGGQGSLASYPAVEAGGDDGDLDLAL